MHDRDKANIETQLMTKKKKKKNKKRKKGLIKSTTNK